MVSNNKGRKLKEKNQKFKHYDPSFKKFIKEKFPTNSHLHYEESDILNYPANKRYTQKYLSSLKLDRKFGNKRVDRYKREFIVFLKNEFGSKSYMDYVENRNDNKIKLNFPDDKRYTQEYIENNEKSKKRVHLVRLKNMLSTKKKEWTRLNNYTLCNECLQIHANNSHQCKSNSSQPIVT